MHIRRATLDDLPRIIAIYAMDAIIGAQETLSSELPDYYRNAFSMIDRDPNQTLLVAETEDTVVGTLQVTMIQYVMSRSLRSAVVEAVFVDPAHQGKGVGTLLMEAAEEWARKNECGAVELTSNKNRPRAHAFYQKLGFRATHEGFKKTLTGPNQVAPGHGSHAREPESKRSTSKKPDR